MIESLLSAALTERFKEDDLSDCFLIDIVSPSKNHVKVFIDSDSHFSLDRCQKVSRFLEKLIEENGWLDEKYTLEVSSPGLDRPLKMKRQYQKNVGRHILVKVQDDQYVEGKLDSVSESGIRIQMDNHKIIEIPFDDIRQAKIMARFK